MIVPLFCAGGLVDGDGYDDALTLIATAWVSTNPTRDVSSPFRSCMPPLRPQVRVIPGAGL